MLNVPDGAAAIADACAACGGVTALIGHSFGGLAALWLAAHSAGSSLRRVVTGFPIRLPLRHVEQQGFAFRCALQYDYSHARIGGDGGAVPC